VVVRVRHLVVLAKLGLRIAILVRVVDRSVIVFVDVVMGTMVEHAGHLPSLVVM
jgi:hypothetical protein